MFDEQAPDRYKFVALDIAAQKVLLGHVEPNRGWVVDTSVAKTLSASTDYAVGLVLRGASASVTINGAFARQLGLQRGGRGRRRGRADAGRNDVL